MMKQSIMKKTNVVLIANIGMAFVSLKAALWKLNTEYTTSAQFLRAEKKEVLLMQLELARIFSIRTSGLEGEYVRNRQ